MSNPVLIEVTRGALVESTHTGSIAIARADGSLALSLGDVARPVFPRSSIKSIQCLPLIESGAADHFNFTRADIALACASHVGTDRHASLAAEMLQKTGLGEADLGCGVHAPLGAAAAKALWRSGREPSQLHNNCSGKHAGMLATAKHLGEELDGYWLPDHPVQQRIHNIMSDLSGLPLSRDVMGIDGCSVPTWALPLSTLAGMFARLVTGTGLSAARAAAYSTIMSACWAEPELVAGPGRADSVVMRKLPGRVFMKTGAEGVYCGGFPELGIGFALKIDDGTTRASAGTAMALVERIIPEAPDMMHRNVLTSWRGIEVGTIRTAAALERAFDQLKV
jgi:L-asparaginase II